MLFHNSKGHCKAEENWSIHNLGLDAVLVKKVIKKPRKLYIRKTITPNFRKPRQSIKYT